MMAELEWRSANARTFSMAAGVVSLIALYICMFHGLAWWEPLPWFAGAWVALTASLSIYMGAPLRRLMRQAVEECCGASPMTAGKAAREGGKGAIFERRGQLLFVVALVLFLVARRLLMG